MECTQYHLYTACILIPVMNTSILAAYESNYEHKTTLEAEVERRCCVIVRLHQRGMCTMRTRGNEILPASKIDSTRLIF